MSYANVDVDEHPIKFSSAPNSFACAEDNAGNFYSPQVMPWGWLREAWTDPRVAPGGEKKSCSVFAPRMHGRSRGKDHFVSADLLVFDSDDGTPMVVSADCVRGSEAFIFPTISNGKTVTRLAKKKNPPLTLEAVKERLRDERKLLPSIIDDVTFDVDDKHIIVHHAPLDKHRIVMPLARTLVMSDYPDRNAVYDAWQTAHLAVGECLNLSFDRACKDISHIHYTPHVMDAGIVLPTPIHVRGEPIDFVARVEDALNAPRVKHPPRVRVSSLKPFRPSSSDVSLRGLELATMLAQAGDTRSENLAKGKVETKCPFDDEHSNPGDENDRGFVVWNASARDSGYAHAFCCHGHCEHRTAEEFVEELSEQGRLPDAVKVRPKSALSTKLKKKSHDDEAFRRARNGD